MKIQGKLHAKLAPETGHGQKGQWHKQNFMLESLDKYPKNFAVQAWNDTQATMNNIPLGTILELDVTPESREYNGKYYTDLKVTAIGFPNKAVEVEQPKPFERVSSGTILDNLEPDLPF
jgi:hypothetical protein